MRRNNHIPVRKGKIVVPKQKAFSIDVVKEMFKDSFLKAIDPYHPSLDSLEYCLQIGTEQVLGLFIQINQQVQQSIGIKAVIDESMFETTVHDGKKFLLTALECAILKNNSTVMIKLA